MVKHTQTIRHCLSVFDHFVGLALKRLTIDAKLSILDFCGSRDFASECSVSEIDKSACNCDCRLDSPLVVNTSYLWPQVSC